MGHRLEMDADDKLRAIVRYPESARLGANRAPAGAVAKAALAVDLILIVLAVAALLILSSPAFALDQVAGSSTPGTLETVVTFRLPARPDNNGRMPAAPMTVSPFVAFLPADARLRILSGADHDLQAPALTKMAAGISFALADQTSAVIVKQIALRAGGRQQTWPRRQPIGSEIPTDHVFEAGLKFKF